MIYKNHRDNANIASIPESRREVRPYLSQMQGIRNMAHRLDSAGGFNQQKRMIADKLGSLKKALKYSYQAAWVERVTPSNDFLEEHPVKALINPNKLKPDYDDKIISVEFEHEYQCGDVFEWKNTDTYWLIYLQDLTELAYFRAEIRKCSYQIEWKDEDTGEICSTYAAVRGPVETKINYIQKHSISVDEPNYSLNLMLPKTEESLKKFKRYSKFYLKDDTSICWRIEAVDSISMPGIIEINAVEYYANKDTDDIENGIVDGLIAEPINPNPTEVETTIEGETFIKPKITYVYKFNGSLQTDWVFDASLPIKYEIDEDNHEISIKWLSSYSGQFDLSYGDYTKTIVVESLF